MALRAGGIQYDLVTGLRVTAGGGKHLGLASKDKAKTRPILTNSPRD